MCVLCWQSTLCFLNQKLIRPCPHESIFVWQRRFFSPAWPTAHFYSVRWKWSPKTHLSKTLSRDKSFINAVLLYLCGRMKTEVFASDYLMVLDPVYPAHELRRHHLAGSDTSKCACSHWRWYRFQWMLHFCLDGQKGFQIVIYGRGFVLKTEKKSPFSAQADTYGRGLNWFAIGTSTQTS